MNTLKKDLKDSLKGMPAIIGIVIVIIVLISIIVGILSVIYFWYQDKKVVDDINSVEISVAYDNCEEGYPLRISVFNKTDRVVDAVSYNLKITRKGYSSDIEKDSFYIYRSDKIVEPGKEIWRCQKYELSAGNEKYNNPDNLNFEIINKSVDFKEL